MGAAAKTFDHVRQLPMGFGSTILDKPIRDHNLFKQLPGRGPMPERNKRKRLIVDHFGVFLHRALNFDDSVTERLRIPAGLAHGTNWTPGAESTRKFARSRIKSSSLDLP
jgi:hypothetical protein